MRRTLTGTGLGAALLAAVALLATPASAASSGSDFSVIFPGDKPATAYHVENTASVANGRITAKSVVSWEILEDQVIDNGKRFSSFKITARLESRPGKDNPDAVETSRTCDLTQLVDDHYTWLLNEPVNTCTAPSTIYDGEVFWSSDSTIVYDIEGDGKGPVTQELLGSPLVHG
ncbi:hypothetical protein [Streptomyces sp. NPDC050548]|uniref:hypothetical protein n=1 Tax=Streptomyces sp. NPDC050548 TaxID=3365629 RepID=UPI00378A1E3D